MSLRLDSFRVGEELTFVSDAYTHYHGYCGCFFSQKIYLCLCAILTAGIASAAPKSELKFSWQAPDSDTGTMFYMQSVTFSLDGYAPLTITADMEKGVYPPGVGEIHKLGPARFLALGGYSAGGGQRTTVAMILAGQDDGRLVMQDQLEFTRDRQLPFYHDRAFQFGNTWAVGFPALPTGEDAESEHAVYAWHIWHQDRECDPDEIRKWALTRVEGSKGDMIVFRIGEHGFRQPEVKQVEPWAYALFAAPIVLIFGFLWIRLADWRRGELQEVATSRSADRDGHL